MSIFYTIILFKTRPKSLDEVLAEMNRISKESDRGVKFELVRQEGNYIIDKITFVEETFQETFAAGWNNRPADGVQVDCSDGSSTICDENDGGCVGATVRRCLDGDGKTYVYSLKPISGN